jgi:hypothetical protein
MQKMDKNSSRRCDLMKRNWKGAEKDGFRINRGAKDVSPNGEGIC